MRDEPSSEEESRLSSPPFVSPVENPERTMVVALAGAAMGASTSAIQPKEAAVAKSELQEKTEQTLPHASSSSATSRSRFQEHLEMIPTEFTVRPIPRKARPLRPCKPKAKIWASQVVTLPVAPPPPLRLKPPVELKPRTDYHLRCRRSRRERADLASC